MSTFLMIISFVLSILAVAIGSWLTMSNLYISPIGSKDWDWRRWLAHAKYHWLSIILFFATMGYLTETFKSFFSNNNYKFAYNVIIIALAIWLSKSSKGKFETFNEDQLRISWKGSKILGWVAVGAMAFSWFSNLAQKSFDLGQKTRITAEQTSQAAQRIVTQNTSLDWVLYIVGAIIIACIVIIIVTWATKLLKKSGNQ